MATISAARLAGLLPKVTSAGDGPAYLRLAQQVQVLTSDGRLPVGVRLPAERDLALALRCSRTTVTSAYGRLREHGWARARRGAGTWTSLPARSGRSSGAWAPSADEAGVLDLEHAAPGAPPQLAAAVAAAAEALPRELPGHGYNPSGMPELRALIAQRYTSRGLPTTPEQIVVTNGALHGLTVALAVLVGPGDRVLVEHPTYPSALDAITDAGARYVPAALGDDPVGNLLRTARQTAPRVAYLMPDFHNPTGLLLDAEQRHRLARGLGREGCIAVIDETFVDVGIDVDPPAPFAVHTAPEHAVTLGTLSKSVWGGLRLGWARAEPDLAARLRVRITRTQLAPPILEQLVACHLLTELDTIRVQRSPELRAQRDHALALLARHFPAWHAVTPRGGLTLWCHLDAPVSTSLAAAADAHGLRLAAGPRFGTGRAFDDRLRIPFTHPPDILDRAFDRLAAAARHAAPARAPADRLIV